jgi:hypothetical protein
VVPEEQDVDADHDGDQREHVKNDDCLSSHRFVLLRAPEQSKNALSVQRAWA